MHALAFAHRLYARLPQEPLRGVIEQPTKRIRKPIEPLQRERNRQRNRHRFLDRRPFWGQFSRADVQKCERGKADRERNRMPRGF